MILLYNYYYTVTFREGERKCGRKEGNGTRKGERQNGEERTTEEGSKNEEGLRAKGLREGRRGNA